MAKAMNVTCDIRSRRGCDFRLGLSPLIHLLTLRKARYHARGALRRAAHGKQLWEAPSTTQQRNKTLGPKTRDNAILPTTT